MDVPLVNTFMGGDAREDPGPELGGGAPDLAGHRARSPHDHGRKITLENCPMLFSYDEWPGGHNIATTPRMWRRILEQWGDTIGLNFDPSHLILQMIDIPRFLQEFGPHILHVQAKDLMIDRDGLYERGIFSMGIGWQVPRLPGLGDVDWGDRLRRAVPRRATTATCIIEHEDRDFEKHRRAGQAGLPPRPRRPPSVLSSEDHDADDLDRHPDRARHRQDDRPLPAPAGARRRVRRGRLPARRRVRRRLGLRPAGRRPPRARRSSPAPTSRSGRRSASRTATTTTETKVDEARRALADGATELDMVIQIGALKSGRDADVQADIAAVVDVAHAGRRDRQGDLRERLPDRRREDPGLPPDRGRRRRLREDVDRLRAERRDPRRPAADAREHLAPHPGQGRRRRPDARRAARGHGPRRDPDRGDRDRGDHRRLPGAQGRRRARRGDGRRRERRAATDAGVETVGIGMLGSGFIGRVPRRRPALRPGRAGRRELGRGPGAARGLRDARSAAVPCDSIDAVCADPGGGPGHRVAAEPPPPRGGPIRGRPRQGRRLHEAARPERDGGRRDARGSSSEPASSTPTSRTSSTAPRWSGCAR